MLRPKFAAFSLVCLLLVTAAGGCSSGESAGAPGGPGGGGRPAAAVNVAPVELRPVEPKVVAVGTVVPVKTSIVASASQGVVDKFNVRQGDFVKKDHVLSALRMKTTDLNISKEKYVLAEREEQLQLLENGSRPEDIAEADAKAAQANVLYQAARRDYERMDKLVRSGARSTEDLKSAKEALEAADKSRQAAEAVAERVKKGPRTEEIEIARAQRDSQKEYVEFLLGEREKRITLAPFDGFVTVEHAEVGQYLALGDPVVTLAQLDEVDVVAQVDQLDIKHVHVGDVARVRVQGEPPIETEGKIVAIVPRSDWESGSRSFPVKVRIKNNFSPGGDSVGTTPKPILTEGMIAEVTFTGTAVQDAQMIPKDALVRTTEGMVIFLFEPDPESGKGPPKGVAKKVLVEVGLSEGDDIQVVSAKMSPDAPAMRLKPGTLVIVEGAERLNPFSPVQILPKSKPATGPAGKEGPPAKEAADGGKPKEKDAG